MATNLPPPPRKADDRFDNWVFTLWKRAVAALVSGGVGATAPITITTSGTGTVNIGHSTSGVVTGTYGSQSSVPIFAVNTWGHVTLATSSAIATDLAISSSAANSSPRKRSYSSSAPRRKSPTRVFPSPPNQRRIALSCTESR